MGFGMVVKEVNVNLFFADPSACYKWILKVSVCHCIIIYTKDLIEINFILLNLLLGPGCLSESTHSKDTVIKVNDGILISFCILLYLLDLDILVWLAANFFFKS